MALTTDLRHSVRLLGRSPVFTVTSIVSLALGIGAAATIFSLTDALALRADRRGAQRVGARRYRARQ